MKNKLQSKLTEEVVLNVEAWFMLATPSVGVWRRRALGAQSLSRSINYPSVDADLIFQSDLESGDKKALHLVQIEAVAFSLPADRLRSKLSIFYPIYLSILSHLLSYLSILSHLLSYPLLSSPILSYLLSYPIFYHILSYPIFPSFGVDPDRRRPIWPELIFADSHWRALAHQGFRLQYRQILGEIIM